MTTQFYASGAGDRLVDADLLPPVVQALLAHEERMLDSISAGIDVLVEVGSMSGLHLEWAVRRGLGYVGVDVVSRYVAEGRARLADRALPADRYRFALADAEELPAVALPPGRAVALFPFNSFGNMARPRAVLTALAGSGLPFAISTYRTDRDASRRRREYYDACGYTGLRVTEDADGVRFRNDEGLDTVAYHPSRLAEWFRAAGLAAEPVEFGGFGLFYVGAPTGSPLAPA